MMTTDSILAPNEPSTGDPVRLNGQCIVQTRYFTSSGGRAGSVMGVLLPYKRTEDIFCRDGRRLASIRNLDAGPLVKVDSEPSAACREHTIPPERHREQRKHSRRCL